MKKLMSFQFIFLSSLLSTAVSANSICSSRNYEDAAKKEYEQSVAHDQMGSANFFGKTILGFKNDLLAVNKIIELNKTADLQIKVSTCTDTVCILQRIFEDTERAYLTLAAFQKNNQISFKNINSKAALWSIARKKHPKKRDFSISVKSEISKLQTEDYKEFIGCISGVNTKIDTKMSREYKAKLHLGRKLYHELSSTQRELLDYGYEYGVSSTCKNSILKNVIKEEGLNIVDVCRENLEQKIVKVTHNHVNNQYRQIVKSSLQKNIDSIKIFASICMNEKDFTKDCINKKFNSILTAKGYHVEQIVENLLYDHGPYLYDLENVKISHAELIDKCLQKGVNIDQLSNGCSKTAYDMLVENGYNIEDEWFIHSSDIFKTVKMNEHIAQKKNQTRSIASEPEKAD